PCASISRMRSSSCSAAAASRNTRTPSRSTTTSPASGSSAIDGSNDHEPSEPSWPTKRRPPSPTSSLSSRTALSDSSSMGGSLPATTAYTRTMRILVAEDETIIRLDLRGLLERAGHEVIGEARDGEEAVGLARELEPDLAVMDVKMPRLDGIEAALRILEERPIPIVMLTAFDQRELVERAAEVVVYGYLVKPFRESDVVPAIETARARHNELL